MGDIRCRPGGWGLRETISGNEELAATWVVRRNRLRASLEKIDVEDFLIGRAQIPVEVEDLCGKLVRWANSQS